MANVNDALIYTKANGYRQPLAIFPLGLYSKVPAISTEKGGQGYKDATTDPAQIRAWWAQYPNANIGLATGSTNGILVIDIDVNHTPGVDGTETMRDLEHELGKLPDTVEVLTPNGGRHLYFKYPAGYNIGSYKSPKENARWPGVDVRGNGGYVAAPPSKIKCSDGARRAYEWELSSYPNETEMAELPEAWIKWLDNLCGEGSKQKGPFVLPDPRTVKVTTRNSTLTSYAGKLRAEGGEHDFILAKLTEYNKLLKDPLPDKEVQAITEHIMKYQPNTTSTSTTTRGKKERMSLEVVADEIRKMGFEVKYNLITCSYEIIGKTPAGHTASPDDLRVLLHNALSDTYKGSTLDIITQYMTMQARENSYNPVLDLLDSTIWDRKDRLPQLYVLMGIESDELSKSLTRKWLKQCIALLFNDAAEPFGADGCLVLNGPQGTGKTSLFRHLALRDAWFGEGCSIDDRDKDTTRRVVTRWISELGEVESTLKSDISKLKALITNAMDVYRLPYGKGDTITPRHTSMCATCNSDRYLIDPTGNRRWWSVPFKRSIPRDELEALDALQLWAQIYAKVKPLSYKEKAACFRLTAEEHAQLAERNEKFEKPSKGQDEVADILAQGERDNCKMKVMTVTEFKSMWPALRNYSAQQISIAIKRCGLTITRTKNGGTCLLPVNG